MKKQAECDNLDGKEEEEERYLCPAGCMNVFPDHSPPAVRHDAAPATYSIPGILHYRVLHSQDKFLHQVVASLHMRRGVPPGLRGHILWTDVASYTYSGENEHQFLGNCGNKDNA